MYIIFKVGNARIKIDHIVIDLCEQSIFDLVVLDRFTQELFRHYFTGFYICSPMRCSDFYLIVWIIEGDRSFRERYRAASTFLTD